MTRRRPLGPTATGRANPQPHTATSSSHSRGPSLVHPAANPQILRLRDLMRRGIAVHHAGLLPIMKEVVEMLFCQGYIKVGVY